MRNKPRKPERQVRRRVREKVLSLRTHIAALARAHGARSVRLFGSAARGEERPESDVDFLIELEPNRSLLDLIGLENDLADLLGRKVEVVPIKCAKPRVLATALKGAIRVFERGAPRAGWRARPRTMLQSTADLLGGRR